MVGEGMRIEELLQQTVNFIPFDRQVWDSKKCAEYLGCSVGHFQNRIARLPTFPNGYAISDGENPTLRWKAKDVFNWVESRELVR